VAGVLIINQNAWNKLETNYIETKESQINYYMEKIYSDLENVVLVNDYLSKTGDRLQISDGLIDVKDVSNLIDGDNPYFDCIRICDKSGNVIQSFGSDLGEVATMSTHFKDALLGNGFVRDLVNINGMPVAIIMSSYYIDNSSEPAGVYSIGRYINQDVLDEMEVLMATDEQLDISITTEPKYMSDVSKHYEEIMFTLPIYEGSDVYFHVHISTPEMNSILTRTRDYQLLIIAIVYMIAIMLFLKYLKNISNGISSTVEKVKEISKSDYKMKIEIDKKIKSKEVVDLVKAVNQITDEFNEKIERIDAQYFSMIDLMADAIEINDAYTSFHNQSVGNYAKLLGNALHYEDMKNLDIAARLHDIGKIGIPTDILNKPGKLTREEFVIIKRHPQIGFQLINNISFFEKAKYGIKYHHERWDGSGYPDGLAGNDIPMIAQIISIADVFDALTSDRPYREAMDCHTAMKIIEESKGTMFNPELVDLFSDLLRDIMEDHNADCIIDIKYLLNEL